MTTIEALKKRAAALASPAGDSQYAREQAKRWRRMLDSLTGEEKAELTRLIGTGENPGPEDYRAAGDYIAMHCQYGPEVTP